MKQSTQIDNLAPTFSGSSAELPFEEIMSLLELSKSTGKFRAVTGDGKVFNLRFSEGLIVRCSGHGGNISEKFRELLTADRLDWSFRKTLGTPRGEFAALPNSLLMNVAFSLSPSRLGTVSADECSMKGAKQTTLQEAKRLELRCEMVRGLGEWILRVERTEEEIARCRNIRAVRAFSKRHGLKMA